MYIHISSDLLIGRLRPQVSNASAVLITAHFSRSLHLTEPVADLLFRLSSVNLWSAAPWDHLMIDGSPEVTQGCCAKEMLGIQEAFQKPAEI
ncbi:hypothetical protein INR49_011929 [Caranx melampygus]|nr:hypothetical protein INR49_011929 [Caranx melampygus]